MPDYSKSCIYMIKKQDDYDNENVYIGSTCNFIRRKHRHKTSCNNENIKCYNLKLYECIRENGGWDAWVMTKIIDYDCNNKSELNIMERRYIDNYKSKLNCKIPMRTKKEHYNDNKEKLLQKNKQYYNDNKEKVAQQQKLYYNDNKEKLLQKNKQYRNDNKEKLSQKYKDYYEVNKNKKLQKRKEYYEENKDKISEKRKERVICDNCGCESSKNDLAKHKKTKKCINFNSK